VSRTHFKLVLQGEIQSADPAVSQFRGYAVSIDLNRLEQRIRRAARNKSRCSFDGLAVVEVTRELLPRQKAGGES